MPSDRDDDRTLDDDDDARTPDGSGQIIALMIQANADNAKAVAELDLKFSDLSKKIDQMLETVKKLTLELSVSNDLLIKTEQKAEESKAARWQAVKSVWAWVTSSVDFKTIAIVVTVLAGQKCADSDSILSIIGLDTGYFEEPVQDLQRDAE